MLASQPNKGLEAEIVIAVWIYWLICLGLTALGLGAFGTRKSYLIRFFSILPAGGMFIHACTSTTIYEITMTSGEPNYHTTYSLPFVTPTYEYDGGEYSIETDASYAVVNLSGYHHFELYRNGGTWPFGIYSVEPMLVEIKPGNVGYIPSKIKGKRNAQASYFVLTTRKANPRDPPVLD